MPGILNWAIAGWHRLTERDRFIQPATGAASAKIFEELTSPVKVFIEQRCELGPLYQIDTISLYQQWLDYCESEGRSFPGTKTSFGKQLHAASAALGSPTKAVPTRIAGSFDRMYRGIRLREPNKVSEFI